MTAQDKRRRRRARLLVESVGLVVGVSLAVIYLTAENPDADPPTPEQPTASEVAQQQVAAALMERHDCWSGDAPADVEVPGHVVVTLPGGRIVHGGPFLTGQALEQVFGGVDHGLTVWGFCR